MKKAIVVVKGNVQRVGYRDFVENVARKLGITGFVEKREICQKNHSV